MCPIGICHDFISLSGNRGPFFRGYYVAHRRRLYKANVGYNLLYEMQGRILSCMHTCPFTLSVLYNDAGLPCFATTAARASDTSIII